MKRRMVWLAGLAIGLAAVFTVALWLWSRRGHEPLHKAAYEGGLQAVKTLLRSGADVNARSRRGYRPQEVDPDDWRVTSATADGRITIEGPPIVTQVEVAGVAVLERPSWARGGTPLHAAVLGGHKDVLQVLLAAGGDPNARDDEGQTPLDLAVGANRPDLVAALLAAGANVNARNDAGWTTLHLAASGNLAGVAKLLLQGGADVHAKNVHRQTALDLARFLKHEETIQVLEAAEDR
ncbi:MAG: ankyrin repeat domain-containing protein [Planctomycetes bacterium]|nr:ankyrin repeat domain-containing protein [Planctomycetota bacterium]